MWEKKDNLNLHREVRSTHSKSWSPWSPDSADNLDFSAERLSKNAKTINSVVTKRLRRVEPSLPFYSWSYPAIVLVIIKLLSICFDILFLNNAFLLSSRFTHLFRRFLRLKSRIGRIFHFKNVCGYKQKNKVNVSKKIILVKHFDPGK